MEPCSHPDFDWVNPYDSDDDMDEVFACTECGWVKWTAREMEASKEVAERLMGATIGRGRAIDHIDGDIFNNDPANLRIVTLSENFPRPRKDAPCE